MTGLIVCVIWGGVAYLAHIASPWFWPIFYGLVAAALALLCCLGFLVVRRTPRPKVIPSTKNIESCVRLWLDNHKIAVKNDPYPDGHFRFRITLDGGAALTVLRSRTEQPDYVHISCDLGMRGEDIKLLKQFTDDEMTEMLLDIKRELARARVGYSGLVYPPENFMIVRNVPIYPTLSEFAFMSMIFDVEAAMNLVGNVFLRMRWRKEQYSAMQPSTSDTPRPALPAT